jgi:primosomal replication protein N
VSRNELTFGGVITQFEPLRYTPAGLPLLSFELEHHSEQKEAGETRTVDISLPVLALGEIAIQLAALPRDQAVVVRGFLTRRTVKSSVVVLHATAWKKELE